jgi:hypothetical protein
MDSPQDLTSDLLLSKIANDDGGDTIDPKPRRKSILKLAPDALLVGPGEQRRPSKRVAFVLEEEGESQSKSQLGEAQGNEVKPQLQVRQSKCCQLW